MAPVMIAEAVKLLAQNDVHIFVEASNILIKIAGNILSNPNNEKYRTLRISNATLSEKLLLIDGGFQCLFDMGFVEADEFLLFPKEAPLEQLRCIKSQLESKRDSLKQTDDKKINTSSADSQSRQPLQQPQMSGMALFQSEAGFFKKLQSNLSHVLLYENSATQNKARQVIPTSALQEKAKQKLHMLAASSDAPDLRDLLLLELMSWFKNDFFQWVNQPPCERCGGSTTSVGMAIPSQQELSFGAQRVENYRCQTCGVHTRFPRYNDPGKLLDTRKGRCGEWANCFTLCCRALGYEARYVLDWTDHVWTEVFSESQNRWLHCDPCENSCDKPLLYEVGWKKKLSYVIAFAKDDIQDVSWRYSCAHKELLSRRQECRESWLVQIIVKLRKQRQDGLDPQHQMQLRHRLLKELVEFLTTKTAMTGENMGRVSGALAWRTARGEIGSLTAGNTVIRPTPTEIHSRLLHLTYCCTSDKYIRLSDNNAETSGWQTVTYEMSNIFRKEESDWKMVYLARTEGSNEASISWKFDFKGTGLVADVVEVTAQSRCYENGCVNWRLCSEEQCAILPADGRRTVVSSEVCGASVLTLTATLSQGQGDVAWQHTQLFRQSLHDKSSPFIIHIKLKPES